MLQERGTLQCVKTEKKSDTFRPYVFVLHKRFALGICRLFDWIIDRTKPAVEVVPAAGEDRSVISPNYVGIGSESSIEMRTQRLVILVRLCE